VREKLILFAAVTISTGKPFPGGERLRREAGHSPPPIGHSDMRVKYCAYGHNVATQLNPRGVTTVSTSTV
jgi:hypothetical protein